MEEELTIFVSQASNPAYRTTTTTINSRIYGSEYQVPVFNSLRDHNVPCAVCYTLARSSKLMIPGEVACPLSWTTEYVGYLMSDKHGHPYNAVYT